MGALGRLAFVSWAGWSTGQVGRQPATSNLKMIKWKV